MKKSIEPQSWNMGPLKRNGVGKHYVPKVVQFDAPARITNGTSTQTYQPGEWWTRPGSCTKHLKSTGKPC